jgi:hypothetical protein
VAAGQAIEVMRGMSAWLGEPQAPDEQGRPVERHRRRIPGRAALVQAMLGAVDQRIGQLRADARQEHATYIKLADDTLPEPVKLTGDVSAWSEEVLLEFGGSARLFPQLGDERLRADLLLKLFRRAQTQLSVAAAGLAPDRSIRCWNAWARCRRRNASACSANGSAAPCPGLMRASRPSSRRNADQFKCFIGVGDPATPGARWKPRSAPPCRPASSTATWSRSSIPASPGRRCATSSCPAIR